jgi:hypothetical protein
MTLRPVARSAYSYHGVVVAAAQVWSRPLSNGDVAVAAHNPTATVLDVEVDLTHWFAPGLVFSQ